MSSAKRETVAWINIAKAMAILLIVLYHVATWFVWHVAPEVAPSWGVNVWTNLSNALIPVRIPLFFLVSGVLAQRAVERSWVELTRTRFISLLWPFILWGLIIALPWSYRVSPDASIGVAWSNVSVLVLGGAHYWYLPALAVMLAVAKLSRRMPGIVVVVTAATSLAITTRTHIMVELFGPYLGVNVSRWFAFAVWFMIGCYFPQIVAFIARRSALWVVAGIVIFMSLRSLLTVDFIAAYPLVVAALTVVGTASFVVLSRFLSLSQFARRWGAFIASRTLPIYVTHALLLEVLAVVASHLRGAGLAPPDGSLFAISFVPFVFTIVIGASVGLFALSRRAHFRWLYEPPAILLRAFRNRPASRT